MKSDLFAIVITTLFTLILPIGIDCCECCSYTRNQIISLMKEDPDYKQNICYIQWKAEKDAEWDLLVKQRDEREKSVREKEENQRRVYEENQRRALEKRRNAHASTTDFTPVEKTQPSTWLLLGQVLGIIFCLIVIICCCGFCISTCQTDDDSTALPTTTTPRNASNTAGIISVPLVTIDGSVNQTSYFLPETLTNLNISGTENQTPDSLPTNNSNTNIIGTENRRPFSREGVINRQNSLPSYDDAMRMPSVPPKE